jgi:hypothetical protein
VQKVIIVENRGSEAREKAIVSEENFVDNDLNSECLDLEMESNKGQPPRKSLIGRKEGNGITCSDETTIFRILFPFLHWSLMRPIRD